MEDDKDKEFKVFFPECKYTMRNEKVEKRWKVSVWRMKMYNRNGKNK